MRKAVALLSLAVLGLMAQYFQQPNDWRAWLNRGVQALKSARYDDAIAAFRKAADLNPGDLNTHLYLGTAYMQKYVPGSATPESQETASRAESEFQQALTMDAGNRLALASLGSLNLNQRKYDQARDWYQRLLLVDPNNRDTYYTLGVIAWSQWYPAYGAARSRMGLRPEQPGPMPEGAAKQDLKDRFTPVIEDGLANLRRALEIDPRSDDAMAYMNLLIRERADLYGTQGEYQRDIAEADQWVARALAVKKEKAQWTASPTPRPPEAQPGQGPPRITIGGDIQQRKLVNRVSPVYPPLAIQAGIQGTVKLSAVILKDGSVGKLQVNTGHPLLVSAALEAVRQWKCQPTLLNGEAVEIQTTVDVNFILDQ